MNEAPGPDPLDSEVSLAARLEKTGLKLAGKSRALAGLDRLIGNLADWFNPAMERRGRLARARIDVDESLIRAEGRAALQAAYSDPEFGRRVADRFLLEEARKQVNREEVARSALEHLSDEGEEQQAEHGELDQDWLNLFASHAERASTERLRDFWGRVMAGEVRRPGAFSLSTLRFVSELDAEIAKAFEYCIRGRYSTIKIVMPHEIRGEARDIWSLCGEVGLLQSVPGSGSSIYHRKSDGYIYIPVGRMHALQISGDFDGLKISVIFLTRVGVEVASLLPDQDLDEVCTQVLERVPPECDVWLLRRPSENEDTGSMVKKLRSYQPSSPPTSS